MWVCCENGIRTFGQSCQLCGHCRLSSAVWLHLVTKIIICTRCCPVYPQPLLYHPFHHLSHFPRQLSTIFAVLIAVAVVRWLSTANTASWLYFFVFTTKSEPEPDSGSTARGLKYLARWFRFASERYLGNSPSVSSVERGSARKRPQMDNESVHGAPRRPDAFLTSAMSVASACTACTVCRLSF